MILRMIEAGGIEQEREKGPVAHFEDMDAELWNIADLDDEERVAALDALEAYKKSKNKEFLAGAVAIAENGDKAVMHNEDAPVGKGQEGHAEMLALASLYSMRPSARSLKILALAGSYPGENLAERTDIYGKEVKTSRDVYFHRVCGRCLKRAADYSGYGVPFSAKTGEREDKSPIVLMVVSPLQVVRTTMHTMHPLPHIPGQMKREPWARDKEKRYPEGTGK